MPGLNNGLDKAPTNYRLHSIAEVSSVQSRRLQLHQLPLINLHDSQIALMQSPGELDDEARAVGLTISPELVNAARGDEGRHARRAALDLAHFGLRQSDIE